jgi:hypothetical protein
MQSGDYSRRYSGRQNYELKSSLVLTSATVLRHKAYALQTSQNEMFFYCNFMMVDIEFT